MEVAKFKKKLFCTGKRYFGVTFPKPICDTIVNRDVEIVLMDNGYLVIKPLNTHDNLKKLVEELS